jgi:hypothetical protein
MKTTWTLVAQVLTCGALAAQAPVQVSPNLRVGPGIHNETWIAVSGANPDVLIAVAQQGDGSPTLPVRFGVSTFLSRDGGRTWAPVALPNAPRTPFDPMVAAGADGRLYVMTGVIGGAFAAMVTENGPPKSTIRFWSSADNGFTWDLPTDLDSSVDPDHMRMVVDQSTAATRGRIYVAWNDVADMFVRDQYEVFLQWSDDHGKTFTAPKLIGTGTDGKLVATEPVVLSDGTLLVTWYQYFNPLARRENERMPMYVARSTDGGRTFAPAEKIFEFGPHVWRERVTEFNRAFSLPIVTADTSSRSPHRDRIYITWDDVSGGTSNIWFVRSLDRGRTWSRPMKINDNAAGAPNPVMDFRMTPVVATAPDGTVGVAWYDRRNDPNRFCWDYYAAFSMDGGATFGANTKLTTAPSCPPQGYAPSVSAHNVSPRLADPNRPPDSVVERMTTIQRLGFRTGEENRAARDEANRALTSSRVTISFDPSRNLWPGHYTGLTADRNGQFHALWLDRRNGVQELFTARVTPGDATAPALVEADLTRDVEVVTGAPAFDASKNTVAVPVQVRNVGRATVYGPIRVRMRGIPGGATFDSTFTFTGRLGSADRLLPRDLSESVTVTLPVNHNRGFDTAYDFTVQGRRPR